MCLGLGGRGQHPPREREEDNLSETWEKGVSFKQSKRETERKQLRHRNRGRHKHNEKDIHIHTFVHTQPGRRYHSCRNTEAETREPEPESFLRVAGNRSA